MEKLRLNLDFWQLKDIYHLRSVPFTKTQTVNPSWKELSMYAHTPYMSMENVPRNARKEVHIILCPEIIIVSIYIAIYIV